MRSCQGTTAPTNQSQAPKGFVTLPYIQGTSERIARTLNQININVAHKPIMNVASIKKKTEDKLSEDLSTGQQEWSIKLIVKTDKIYIGQTSRVLRSKTREHKRAIFTGDKNPLLAQHSMQNNHEFDFDDVKTIDCCSQWSKRFFLEAWHSTIRDPNASNIYKPGTYKALGNPKWRFPTPLSKHSLTFERFLCWRL